MGAGKHCTPLIWMIPPRVLQKREKEKEMYRKTWKKLVERHGRSSAAGALSILPSYLLISGAFS